MYLDRALSAACTCGAGLLRAPVLALYMLSLPLLLLLPPLLLSGLLKAAREDTVLVGAAAPAPMAASSSSSCSLDMNVFRARAVKRVMLGPSPAIESEGCCVCQACLRFRACPRLPPLDLSSCGRPFVSHHRLYSARRLYFLGTSGRLTRRMFSGLTAQTQRWYKHWQRASAVFLMRGV